MEPALSQSEIAAALNEWMRRYIEDPAGFEREFETVREFERESAEGEPSYGSDSAAYLLKIHNELNS